MVVFVKKSSLRAKKSSPLPLWGHCLPVTALALSARRPAGFARGLDYCEKDEDVDNDDDDDVGDFSLVVKM